jgi:very-short-patch-repair endonuclease
MRQAIDELLNRSGCVASRAELLRVVTRAQLDDEIRRRHLVAVFPRAYARPWDADLECVQRRAALASVGGEVALSHLTALRMHRLPVPTAEPLHVTAFQPRHPRGVRDQLIVHRTLLPLNAAEVDELPVVRPVTAVATSWPLLQGADQRAPAIVGARMGIVSPFELSRTAERMWWLAQRSGLLSLAAALAAGVESELELWGYSDVFAVPGLDHVRRQVRVAGRIASYRLDMAYVHERVAVELDGRRYHASTAQWERDIARDLDLATQGWQTVRLSHQRLTSDPEGCRRDVLAVLAHQARSRGLAS